MTSQSGFQDKALTWRRNGGWPYRRLYVKIGGLIGGANTLQSRGWQVVARDGTMSFEVHVFALYLASIETCTHATAKDDRAALPILWSWTTSLIVPGRKRETHPLYVCYHSNSDVDLPTGRFSLPISFPRQSVLPFFFLCYLRNRHNRQSMTNVSCDRNRFYWSIEFTYRFLYSPGPWLIYVERNVYFESLEHGFPE